MDNKKEDKYCINKIVHEYGNVNLRIVYDCLTEEIPQLYELLTNLDIL